jgi:hypothetical protein
VGVSMAWQSMAGHGMAWHGMALSPVLLAVTLGCIEVGWSRCFESTACNDSRGSAVSVRAGRAIEPARRRAIAVATFTLLAFAVLGQNAKPQPKLDLQQHVPDPAHRPGQPPVVSSPPIPTVIHPSARPSPPRPLLERVSVLRMPNRPGRNPHLFPLRRSSRPGVAPAES